MSRTLAERLRIHRRAKVLLGWDESKHPREPAGSPDGGQFTGGGGGGDAAAGWEATASGKNTKGEREIRESGKEVTPAFVGEYTWYFSFSPFGPKTPTPGFYRASIKDLRSFNDRLQKCEAVFDARADNLLQFIDRIANDLGGTSAILRDRSEKNNSGWFDTRADDRFWFAYGQLYGYYGILSAARADFRDVITQRGLDQLWTILEDQFRSALKIQPFIISNGSEAGWLMPAHLATMGFYVLRVRSNLVELRLVLDR